MISAKIILDSISLEGYRLVTMELRYPKFIHGELMTHRVLSRNASSSRAIPTSKLLEEVRSDELRAGPVFWGKNQSGMQAAEELTGAALLDAKLQWRSAAHRAADWAEAMMKTGAHKQIANRMLEPFSHINVLVSATEYMNFFGLRLDRAAQPEMRALALAMWEEYSHHAPTLLHPGQWHLPYVDPPRERELIGAKDLIKCSVARCARVSYKSHETGKVSTLQEDLALYDRLAGSQPIHASPLEHQATPDEGGCITEDSRMAIRRMGQWANPDEHGNFVGWRQYRKTIADEACAPLPKEI